MKRSERRVKIRRGSQDRQRQGWTGFWGRGDDRRKDSWRKKKKGKSMIFLWWCSRSLNHSLWSLHPFKLWHMQLKCTAEKQPIIRSVALTLYWSCPSLSLFLFPFVFGPLNLHLSIHLAFHSFHPSFLSVFCFCYALTERKTFVVLHRRNTQRNM